MKKKKKSLLSLNKTRIHNLHQLSRIIGGEETNACDTYKDDCRCEETFSCPSSAYAPPTGIKGSPIIITEDLNLCP